MEIDGDRDTKEFVEIFPTNAPSNGVFSRNNGTHIMRFNLAPTEAFVKPGTMRLCFKFKCLKGDGTNIGSNTTIPTTAGAVAADQAFINPRLGVYGLFDQLTLSNVQGMKIEQINFWNRLMSALIPTLHSTHDQLDDLTNEDASSDDFIFSQRQINGGLEISCSMRIYSGLLYNERRDIPLSNQWGLNGLNLQLQLASDSQVFFNLGRNGGTASTGASANGGAQFQLSDVSLMCEYVRPSPTRLLELKSKTSGVIEYNSFSSLYNVVNSSNHNYVSELGAKNVVSCFGTFLPVVYNNSTNGDAFTNARMVNSTTAGQYDGNLVNIDELSFTRNGVKFPQEYVVRRNNQESAVVHSQIMRNFVDSIRPFHELLHSVVQPVVANQCVPGYGSGVGTNYDRSSLADKTRDGGALYGIGCPYDVLGDRGANFAGAQFGVQIQSDLGVVGNESPHALYLFFLNRETFMYSPQGLQVMI